MDYKNNLKEIIKNKYWYQRDGTGIKLKNMKITHLKNCINMCKRKNLIDNVRILECALSIKENRFDEFFKKDNLANLVTIKIIDIESEE